MSFDRRSFVAAFAAAPLLACDRSENIAPPARPSAATPKSDREDLVELIQLDPSIRLDIRYASTNNFTGRKLYSQGRAFLIRPAAEALLRAHRAAQSEGLGLTIYDAYRPWRITKALWDATPPGPKRNYVANPKKGSRHNRGCAVDLTLHDLATGRQVEMPSGYDEFTERAHRNYTHASSQALQNRARLEKYLEAEGFHGISNEWWHFDYKSWELFPLRDIPFEQLG